MCRLPCLLVLTAALALAACQSGTGTAVTTIRRATPSTIKATVKPGAVTKPGAVLPVGATKPPVATATPGGPTPPAPSMYVPAKGSPTPLPAGYVTPLPPDAFPSASATATPAPANATPTPTPLPTPVVQSGQVLTNNLPPGTGELTGYIVEPVPSQAGQYRALSGVTVLVSNKDDLTEKAKLTNGSNGTFKLPDVALGEYYVRVEKTGYASDSAPTPVRIYPGYTSGHTLFLIVPDAGAL